MFYSSLRGSECDENVIDRPVLSNEEEHMQLKWFRPSQATTRIAQSIGTPGIARARTHTAGLSRRAQLFWTLGNFCMLIGVVLLFYVGGIYSQAEYERYAARGDTDLPAPAAVTSLEQSEEPAPFIAPILNQSGSISLSSGQIVSAAPTNQAPHQSTVTRVVIPSIGVDSKVVEVGWEVEEQNNQQVAVWQVAEYAVGQHRGSANPGEGGNVVMAGHVGGYGKVFKDLFYVKPGDQITLYSAGQQYLYTVQERLLVTEEGVADEQHAANAQLIAPTDHEVVTLVTCWPAKGADKFTQRVVVRATPFGATATHQLSTQSSWSIR
jgi:LPXTG-site transpeptidase (sortase) family protein